MSKYVDQSAKDLHLCLSEGTVDLKPLKVIAAKSIQFGDVNVVFGVLGASHFVTIQNDIGTANEVFSCAPDLSQGVCLLSKSVQAIEHPEFRTVLNTILYRFDVHSHTWETGKPKLNMLINKCKDGGLVCHFPTVAPDKECLTAIVLTTANETLRVETVHCYPNEDKMIFTESFFTKGRK